MSDGMRDTTAVSELAGSVYEAAYVLRDALKDAQNGYRGLCPHTGELERRLQQILGEAGWDISKRR